MENGDLRVFGEVWRPSREFLRRTGFFTLPEEPLENAAVGSMTVAENLALRTFDAAPLTRSRFLLDGTSVISPRALDGQDYKRHPEDSRLLPLAPLR
jgi:simple sugar transport system ATP-binding protein